MRTKLKLSVAVVVLCCAAVTQSKGAVADELYVLGGPSRQITEGKIEANRVIVRGVVELDHPNEAKPVEELRGTSPASVTVKANEIIFEAGSELRTKSNNELVEMNIMTGRVTADLPLLRCNVPYYTNDRLAIQKGTFVFSLSAEASLEDLVRPVGRDDLIIPASLFGEIRNRLNEFNCNSRVLFPGIGGYAR